MSYMMQKSRVVFETTGKYLIGINQTVYITGSCRGNYAQLYANWTVSMNEDCEDRKQHRNCPYLLSS